LNTPIQQLLILKGFEYQGIESVQADLGIEVILKLFSKMDLQICFRFQVCQFQVQAETISDNSKRIYALQEEYLKTITLYCFFDKEKHPTLASNLSRRFSARTTICTIRRTRLGFGTGNAGQSQTLSHLVS
jgi:hypothetical protein